jgi:hypothetical protein
VESCKLHYFNSFEFFDHTGIEFYLIEQEGSEYPEMETAERCLAAFRKIRREVCDSKPARKIIG